jgi:hypothetical protein
VNQLKKSKKGKEKQESTDKFIDEKGGIRPRRSQRIRSKPDWFQSYRLIKNHVRSIEFFYSNCSNEWNEIIDNEIMN